MSLIFMDGMYYPTDDLLFKYSDLSAATISAETSRVGPGSLNVARQSSASVRFIDYSPPHDLEGVTIGFRYKTTTTPNVDRPVVLQGTGIEIEFNANYSMKVDYPGGSFTTDPAIMEVNVWSYVELQYVKHASAGTVTLKINGVIKGSASGLSLNVDTTYITMKTSLLGATQYFQDLYILDGLGSTNNDFLGDTRVDIIRPVSAGTNTDFIPSAGANWANVDEYDCDDDTTYNKSSIVGDKDSYTMGDISVTGGEIFGIQQQSIVRKDDASIRYGKQLLISGTTEDLGDEQQFSDTYVAYQRILEVDPDTLAAWIESGVNAIESGLEVTA